MLCNAAALHAGSSRAARQRDPHHAGRSVCSERVRALCLLLCLAWLMPWLLSSLSCLLLLMLHLHLRMLLMQQRTGSAQIFIILPTAQVLGHGWAHQQALQPAARGDLRADLRREGLPHACRKGAPCARADVPGSCWCLRVACGEAARRLPGDESLSLWVKRAPAVIWPLGMYSLQNPRLRSC